MTTPPQKPTLTIDVMEFEHLLETSDAPDDEKREYLQLIWEIMCEFAMIGFNIHPVQQVEQKKNCGQHNDTACTARQPDSDTVESTMVGEFIRATKTEKESTNA